MSITKETLSPEVRERISSDVSPDGYHPQVRQRAIMMARWGAAGIDIEKIYEVTPEWGVPRELVLWYALELGLV